ncbi:MAG: protein disulfide oxidoreductase, partial [Anaerolineae bacterium]
MAVLNDEIRQQVHDMLADLPHPVRLLVFSKPEDCPYCSIIEELTQEIADVSDNVSVQKFDVTQHTEA